MPVPPFDYGPTLAPGPNPALTAALSVRTGQCYNSHIPVEFRVLGPLAVVEDGRAIPLDRQRLRALLAYLLLHANEVISTDRLIDEVWGPTPPKTAGASLQNYVSRLRKAIGAELIVSQPAGYVLRVDPEQFDLTRFERLTAEARGAEPRERAEKLRAALALWRGPALEDLAFEPFARDEVGRLEEARLAALEQRIDADLELGSAGGLVGELEQLVERHPLRERFRAQLMLALYRAGRQAEALEAYREARRVLMDELGLEPSEELRALQQAILQQDASLGASSEGIAARDPEGGLATRILTNPSVARIALDPMLTRATPTSKNGRATTIRLPSTHCPSNMPSVASPTAAMPPGRASPRRSISARLPNRALYRRVTYCPKRMRLSPKRLLLRNCT
jgi:DNA-binding SARP family transcriptional activator